ncbi:MAG: class I SAM-dependent methyltransferase, partial [Ruminococcus sp.]
KLLADEVIMKYYKLVLNARNPKGFWGKMMIRNMNKNHFEVTGWGLSHWDFKPTDVTLDVGCGGGMTVNRISKMVQKAYGVDYSELAVNKAEKLNKKQIKSGKAEFCQASVSHLPFDDNMFDVVTAVETYYFWPDKLNDLKEVLRVLKSGGKLLMVFGMCRVEDNPDKWQEVEELINIKSVTEQEITDILKEAGYVNIKTDVVPENSWLTAVAEKG